MANQDRMISTVAQFELLRGQVHCLVQSNCLLRRNVQELVNINRSFFEAQEHQAMLLNDVVENLKNHWISFDRNTAENQVDPLREQLEGLVDIQEREIYQLKGLLAEKNVQLEKKSVQLEEKSQQLSQLQQRVDTANSLIDDFEATEPQFESTLNPFETAVEYSDDESNSDIEEAPAEESGSESSDKESKESDNSDEEPFSEISEEKAAYETSSGVSCEEPAYCSSSHLVNWTHQQKASLDLSKSSLGQRNCKIKVSNLPRDVKMQQLTSVFGASGPIKDVIIAQKSKSAIAFIIYQEHGSAVNAVKTQSGRYFNGKPIAVAFDEQSDFNRTIQAPINPPLSYASSVKQEGTWESVSSFDSLDFFAVPMKARAKAIHTKSEIDCLKDRTIYVKDFQFDATEKTLEKSFRTFGVIENIDIKRRDNYAFAFIRFKTVQSAQAAKNTGIIFVGNAVVHIGSSNK